MTSTCNVPPLSLRLRREYLHDLESGHGDYVRAYWFAIHSWEGRALDCIVHTEHGCIRDQLPLSALCTKEHPEHIPLEFLELWNCMSYDVTAVEYEYLSAMPCRVLLKDGSEHTGEYRFTIDWFGSGYAEAPGDEGRKSGHIVELSCGCIAMVPNNRLLVYESSFAVKAHRNFEEARAAGYKVNSREWRVERSAKFVTEDSGQFYYSFERREEGPSLGTALITTARENGLLVTRCRKCGTKTEGAKCRNSKCDWFDPWFTPGSVAATAAGETADIPDVMHSR